MRLITVFICAVFVAIALAACGSEDDSGGDDVEIVATTGIVADIVANVAGPDAEVEQLIPSGSSPHDFQLSADDRRRLEEADLVAANGAALEATIPLDELDGPLWELSAHTGELLGFEEGGDDPHVWMDPTRVAPALPPLAAALAEADPDHRADYEERARAYAAELRRLDRELRRTLATIPGDDRELVTSHDALAYLADRYGFEVVATAFPVTGPEGEPSASELDEVADTVETSGVSAVFAGEEDDPEVLRLIADQAGVEVIDDLLIESTGEAGTYEAMLRHDAERIAAALGG